MTKKTKDRAVPIQNIPIRTKLGREIRQGFGIGPKVPKTGGAVVTGTDPCTCGDAPEEHGRDPEYPGSTACIREGCDCIAYEADPS